MITANINVEEIVCATEKCGILMLLPIDYLSRRRKDQKNFYCPNGHTNWFPGITEEMRLQRIIDKKNSEIEQLKKKARKNKK